MKKLITGAVAALALLFGFASCSGDLHDNDVLPLTIVGMTADAGNHVIPMTLDKADGSEQSLTFTLKDGFELTARDGKKYKLSSNPADSWRDTDPLTALHFKVIPGDAVKADGTPDWTMDYASLNKEDPQYITAGDDFQKVGKRGDANVSGDPKHLILDGAIEGEEYVLRAKYNAAAGTLELKLDGTKNDPAGVKFVFDGDYKNFPAKDADEKDLSYSMSRAVKTYTYQFVSIADETISFDITNDMQGTLGSKSLTVKTNVEYKITVDISAGISNAKISTEVVDMLKDATVNANWKYADAASSYAEKITSDSYQFFAEREEIDFTVLRHDGGVWGKDTVGTFNIDSDAVELAYSTSEDAAKATTVKVKGLKVGTCYKVVLEKDNDNFTLKAKVITVPIDSYFEAGDLVGDMGNDGIKLTKESDDSYSWSFTYDSSWSGWGGGSGKLVFAMRYVAGYWTGGQTKFSGFYKGTFPTGYDYVENSSNPAITGMENGKKYKLSFVPDYGRSKVNLEIVE